MESQEWYLDFRFGQRVTSVEMEETDMQFTFHPRIITILSLCWICQLLQTLFTTPVCDDHSVLKIPSLVCVIFSFSTWHRLSLVAYLSPCISIYLAAAKSLQSCLTLCDPIDGSPPGSPVPGILQARTLERVAISFSNAWKWKVKVKLLNCARLLLTPWTAAFQAPPSMRFSRQEYWSGVPLPSPFLPM